MSSVDQRLAMLQELVRHADLGPRLSEAWSRAEGLCALGAVLVPLSEAGSASWHEFLSAAEPTYLVQNLGEPRNEDRLFWGPLARGAFALGLTAGFLLDHATGASNTLVVEPVKHSRKPGAMEALVLRLNGLDGAPAALTLVDLEAWMGALGKDALAGADVEIPEQALHIARPLLVAMEEALAEGDLSSDALANYNAMLSAAQSA